MINISARATKSFRALYISYRACISASSLLGLFITEKYNGNQQIEFGKGIDFEFISHKSHNVQHGL